MEWWWDIKAHIPPRPCILGNRGRLSKPPSGTYIPLSCKASYIHTTDHTTTQFTLMCASWHHTLAFLPLLLAFLPFPLFLSCLAISILFLYHMHFFGLTGTIHRFEQVLSSFHCCFIPNRNTYSTQFQSTRAFITYWWEKYVLMFDDADTFITLKFDKVVAWRCGVTLQLLYGLSFGPWWSFNFFSHFDRQWRCLIIAFFLWKR